MSMTAGHRQKIIRPRCVECDATTPTHPYPRENATEMQLNGSVPGGYDWLCADCAYRHVYNPEPEVRVPQRAVSGPPQRERLFDC